jgi:hypothetical protein
MSGHVANYGLESCMYNASKAGVNQLAKNLAMEWGKRSARDQSRLRVDPGLSRCLTRLEVLCRKGLCAEERAGEVDIDNLPRSFGCIPSRRVKQRLSPGSTLRRDWSRAEGRA